MKRSLSFLILLLTFSATLQAQTFFKTYTTGGFNEWIFDVEPMSGGGSALLCATRVLIVDNTGNPVREFPLPPDFDLYYTDLAIAPDGRIYVVSENMMMEPSQVTVTVYTADGVLENQATMSMTFTSAGFRLHFSGNNLYLSYMGYPEDKPNRAMLHRLGSNGTELWHRQIPEGTMSWFSVNTDDNGGIGIAFLNPEDFILRIANFNENGDRLDKAFIALGQPGDWGIPAASCRTPDGGYLFAGTENAMMENSDLVVLKFDADGRLEWRKNHDVMNHDALMAMGFNNNGYYLMTISGTMQEAWQQDYQQDIALVRLDLNGNLQWKKAFGSIEGMDAPTCMAFSGENVLIAGFLLPRNNYNYKGFLIKTNKEGEIQQPAFPHRLEEQQTLKEIKLPLITKTQELVSAINLPDGGMMAVAQVIGTTDRAYSAWACRLNAEGQQVWQLPLGESVSRVGAMKATPDGNFVAITEEQLLGYLKNNIVKFGADGRLLWTRPLWEDNVNDLTVLPDGSVLAVGFDNEPTSGYDNLLLVKLTASGAPAWRRIHSIDWKSCKGLSVCLTSDQRLLIAGVSYQAYQKEFKPLLLKTDLNGNAEWLKTYEGPEASSVPNLVIETKDNQYLMGGYTEPLQSDDRDIMLIKTDRSGNQVWSKRYDLNKLDEVKCLIPRGDTAWSLAGTTGEPSHGSLTRYGFLANVRTDGAMNRTLYYGREHAQTNITALMPGQGNAVSFTANIMLPYGTSTPFLGKHDPGVVLSSGEPDLLKAVSIVPIPARGAAWLKIDNDYIGYLRIFITGINGIRLKDITSRKSVRNLQLPLPVQGLAAGIYQVEILMNKTRVSKRLIILP